MHMCVYAHMPTCVRVYVRVCLRVLRAPKCMHVYVCVCVCMRAYVRAYVHAYVRMCMSACLSAYVSTHYVLFNIINVIWHIDITCWLSVNYVMHISWKCPFLGHHAGCRAVMKAVHHAVCHAVRSFCFSNLFHVRTDEIIPSSIPLSRKQFNPCTHVRARMDL